MVLYRKFAINQFKVLVNFFDITLIVWQARGNYRFIEISQQHFIQRRYLLCIAVIALHKLFDRIVLRLAFFTYIAELRGDITLIVE